MDNLGLLLLQWRTKKNLSQQAVAQKLRVTQSTVCKWESGKLAVLPEYYAALKKLISKK